MKKTITKVLTWIPALVSLTLAGLAVSAFLITVSIGVSSVAILYLTLSGILWPFTNGVDLLLKQNKDLHTCADNESS